MLNQYIPILVMVLAASGTAIGMIVVTTLLGPKAQFPEKMEPFECGVSPVSSPKSRFSVRFYIIAMMFIVFDIEAVFLFPWAVAYNNLGLFARMAKARPPYPKTALDLPMIGFFLWLALYE